MHRHPETSRQFAELGLETPILRAIAEMGFVEPSPIQKELIPAVISGRDVLGQAKTGTGKTAAFGLPVLQQVDPQGRLQAIVLTPTRELAAQVVGEFRRMAKHLDLHCVPVYGGVKMKEQMHMLGRRPHVVVGTPGRVIDLLDRKSLSFEAIRFAVLDEVDRMLDIGFRDDIRNILRRIDHPHQTVFVSATIDEDIKKLAFQFMNDPQEVNVSRDELTVEQVEQQYVVVEPWDKFRALALLLKQESPRLAIIFCRTKHGARKLAQRLFATGVQAKDIHGDLVQQKRERIMDRFRKHKIPVLVATDLAARGIDVHEISHIINYDLPEDPQIYVHRIGRTARMGASGKAVSLVTSEQGADLTKIEMLINKQLARIEVNGFTPSPEPSERGVTGHPPHRRGARPGAAPKPVQVAAASPSIPAASNVAASSAPNLGGKFKISRRGRRR